MCLDERNTDSRGRPLAPLANERRTRRARRSNWLSLLSMNASLFLAFLHMDVLAPVANAFTLIGLGWPRGADDGRHLSHLLLVDAGDLDDLLLGTCHLHVDASRDLVDHVVAKSDLQLQGILALERGTETHAMDLERVRVALGHALDEIGDLRARHAPERSPQLGLLARRDLDAVGAVLHLDLLRTGEGELALWPLHLDRSSLDGRGDPGGDDHRVPTDARHRLTPSSLSPARAAASFRTRYRGSRHRRSPRVPGRPTSRPWGSTGWQRRGHWPRSSDRVPPCRRAGRAWTRG